MSVITPNAIQFDPRTLSDLATKLCETFGGEVQFWLQSDQWHHLTSSGDSDRTLSDEADHPELGRLLTESAATGRPEIVSTESATVLGIPIPRSSRKALVAVCEFECEQSDWLLKLAELFQRDLRSQSELLSLRQENQAFLRQVTNDFEELTFLRSMAELLEISELSFDFTAMAETVLPTLKPLLEADGLVLVAAENEVSSGKETLVHVGQPTVWAGSRSVSPETCQQLVIKYRSQCEVQPVVKNNFEGTPEAAGFPGVTSFIIVPIVNGTDFIGWLLALNRNNDRNMNTEDVPWEVSYLEFGTHEATLMSSSAAILATHARNVELFREREELLVSMVRALVSAIEAKDEYTRGHSERVALYGRRIAEELGLGAEYCERLYLTGLLHDVGKIGVRDAVLRKPGPLTDEEFEEIKQHPDKGWSILQDLEPLNYVLPGVLHHHENYNGRGYPDGLAGEDIPLDGRILAVADAFDAMTSDRPYRTGMPVERAETILKEGSGRQWDADMIDAFLRAMPDILTIKKTYQPRVQPIRQIAKAGR
ncbi:MAG: HD-GYP domain-containing protein [Planctomycetaceae bacterium]|nr:HD-GYP domain-containing protein [Planctomycetales bacterium]MCB9923846.1 HD-GYP domain-containing protein [Planctomycetaceae bacterium]